MVFARALIAAGHEPLIDPVIDIENLTVPAVDIEAALAGAQAVLFTSANGVRAFSQACDRRDLPAICVGPATEEFAVDAGFERVETSGGDVTALAKLARKMCNPARGPLAHPAGRDRAGDLAALLGDDGFSVRRLVLYHAVESTELTPETSVRLRTGSVDAVTLFSPRSARIFCRLATAAGLTEHFSGVTAICLSLAVADATIGPWADIRIAPAPTAAEMIKMINALALAPRD